MYDVLQKIGVPATVAAVVSALVVVMPFIFKLDERYAKEEDVQAYIAHLEEQNTALQKELAELSGFQSAMIAWLQAKPQVVGGAAPVQEVAAPARGDSAPEIVGESVGAVPEKLSSRPSLAEISKAVTAQQERLQK